MRIAAAALALCLALVGSAIAASDADTLLGFADRLEALGEHYRAATEYLRFVDSFPSDPRAPVAFLAVGRCHLAGERWGEARSWFGRFRDAYPSEPGRGESWLLEADSYIAEGRAGEALALLAAVRETLPEGLADRAIWTAARAAVAAGAWDEARALAVEAQGRPALRVQGIDLAAGLDGLTDVPRRSPTLAGILSAAIPGTGQLYAKRPADAFWAFAINAAFLWAAVSSFKNDNDAAGIVFSFFELGWYTGNIYNAANQTERFNRRALDDFSEGLSRTAGWRVGLAPAADGAPMFAATWRW